MIQKGLTARGGDLPAALGAAARPRTRRGRCLLLTKTDKNNEEFCQRFDAFAVKTWSAQLRFQFLVSVLHHLSLFVLISMEYIFGNLRRIVVGIVSSPENQLAGAN